MFRLAVMRLAYLSSPASVVAAFNISLYSAISASRSLILSSRVAMSERRQDKTRRMNDYNSNDYNSDGKHTFLLFFSILQA